MSEQIPTIDISKLSPATATALEKLKGALEGPNKDKLHPDIQKAWAEEQATSSHPVKTLLVFLELAEKTPKNNPEMLAEVKRFLTPPAAPVAPVEKIVEPVKIKTNEAFVQLANVPIHTESGDFELKPGMAISPETNKELYDLVTKTLIQRNKIISAETAYIIKNIYPAKEKPDTILVDIMLPLRADVRTKDEKITVAAKDFEEKKAPDTVIVNGENISKGTVLSADLIESVNEIGKRKGKTADSWTVTKIFLSTKTGDVLLNLEGSKGETYQVNPNRLDTVTKERKLNNVEQATEWDPGEEEALDAFLESRFRFPIAPVKTKEAVKPVAEKTPEPVAIEEKTPVSFKLPATGEYSRDQLDMATFTQRDSGIDYISSVSESKNRVVLIKADDPDVKFQITLALSDFVDKLKTPGSAWSKKEVVKPAATTQTKTAFGSTQMDFDEKGNLVPADTLPKKEAAFELSNEDEEKLKKGTFLLNGNVECYVSAIDKKEGILVLTSKDKHIQLGVKKIEKFLADLQDPKSGLTIKEEAKASNADSTVILTEREQELPVAAAQQEKIYKTSTEYPPKSAEKLVTKVIEKRLKETASQEKNVDNEVHLKEVKIVRTEDSTLYFDVELRAGHFITVLTVPVQGTKEGFTIDEDAITMKQYDKGLLGGKGDEILEVDEAVRQGSAAGMKRTFALIPAFIQSEKGGALPKVTVEKGKFIAYSD